MMERRFLRLKIKKRMLLMMKMMMTFRMSGKMTEKSILSKDASE